MHAVSVGEVNVCTQLIRALEPRLPNLKIVVSTTTTTGMGELQRKLPTHISKIYYPIDRRKYVARALGDASAPRPSSWSRRKSGRTSSGARASLGIPVFLVNARLSDRSYRGYKRFGFLFRPLFALVRRRRRAERGGRRQAARTGLPAGSRFASWAA